MVSKSLEIAIAAGGTAGHINPALALAEELEQRGHHVTFYGQTDRLEGKLVPQAGFDFVPIRVSGFDRSRPWTAVSGLYRIKKAEKTIGRHCAQTAKPDVAVGFGAYVELPLINWCHAHDVPCVIHEQNSVPGLANKMSAKKCTSICVGFPKAVSAFTNIAPARTTVAVTGNPVRRSVLEADGALGRRTYGIPEDARMLLVFGGSLGAHHINETVIELKEKLMAHDDLYVVLATGQKDYERSVELAHLTEEQKRRFKIVNYIENMGEALAAADLVISRSGASSVAEIAALEVPAILVPYPFATADHQTTNAKMLQDAGAAVLIQDDELTCELLMNTIDNILYDEKTYETMKVGARALAQAQAASGLANQVESASDPCCHE